MNYILAKRSLYAILGVIALTATANTSLAQPAAASAPNAASSVARTSADINAGFLDPEMDPEEWAKRFEVESREVFTARDAVLAAVGLKPGDVVADIGAGTGLYTVLFAHEVGRDGWVYAVDISPRFVEHISSRAAEAGIGNISPVLCSETSVCLAPENIDVAYVCDTYHHFAHPSQTLASIHSALRPGGRLVVVDFEREEGVSSDWVLGHVRAGKAVVTAEIQAAGFGAPTEPEVIGLSDNYLLVFRKSTTAPD